MIEIKTRTVKVGSGNLYAEYAGQVVMKVLSSRKLRLGLNRLGNFNNKSMWLTNWNDEVIIQADVKAYSLFLVSCLTSKLLMKLILCIIKISLIKDLIWI